MTPARAGHTRLAALALALGLAALAMHGACSNGASRPAATSSTSAERGSAVTPPSATAALTAAHDAGVPAAAGAPGTVRTVTFESAALGVDKDYVVYLPAGYDAHPERRYPVFYYLHGLGGNERNWVDGAALDKAADALGLQAIVVMPDGDDSFYVDAKTLAVDYDACMKDGTGLFLPGRQNKRATCVRKRAYDAYMTRDLIAHVDATYRTIATRQGRAIAGLSMGGFGALQLAMRHPELFAAAASHSGVVALLYGGPHPYAKGQVTPIDDARQWGGPFVEIKRWMLSIFGDDLAHWRVHDPAELVKSLTPGSLALYLDCGTEDMFFLHNPAAYLHDLLLDRKIEHAYYQGPGRHDFMFWTQRVPHSLAFLREHTTAAR